MSKINSATEILQLKDICDILNGFAFKSIHYVGNGIRIIRIANVQKGHIVDDAPQFYPITSSKSISNFLLDDGDLLMSLTGNVGRVGIIDSPLLPAALNQRVACIRIKDEEVIDKRYLFYLFNDNYFETQCILSSKGIAQKNMSTEWLKEYTILIPKINRQREIVVTLDKTSELITLHKKQLEELDALAESVFYDMFGDPVKNEKGWEMKQWKNLFETRLGKMLDKKKQVASDALCPYLGNSNVLWSDFKLEALQMMTFSAKEQKILELKPNDLLICEGGEAGRCAIWNNETSNIYFQKAIHRARVIDTHVVNVKYIQKLIFQMKRLGGLKKYLSKATIEHLTGEKLNTVYLPIPSIELQTRFASIIEKIEEQKAQVKKALQESEDLFQRLMQDLFRPN